MQALIPINNSTINGAMRQTVDARELHAFLGVGKKFADWMTDRISQYSFAEGIDFVVIPEIGKNGGRPLKQYHLTLDMAKELSMVERTAKGKEARLYFIDCERRALAAATPKTPGEALVEMAQNFLRHEREIMALQHQQAETAAQVKALVDGEDHFTIVGYANLIGEKVDVARSRKLGKIASRICRDNNWPIGSAAHPVFGSIHSYPRQAVALAFDQE